MSATKKQRAAAKGKSVPKAIEKDEPVRYWTLDEDVKIVEGEPVSHQISPHSDWLVQYTASGEDTGVDFDAGFKADAPTARGLAAFLSPIIEPYVNRGVARISGLILGTDGHGAAVQFQVEDEKVVEEVIEEAKKIKMKGVKDFDARWKRDGTGELVYYFNTSFCLLPRDMKLCPAEELPEKISKEIGKIREQIPTGKGEEAEEEKEKKGKRKEPEVTSTLPDISAEEALRDIEKIGREMLSAEKWEERPLPFLSFLFRGILYDWDSNFQRTCFTQRAAKLIRDWGCLQAGESLKYIMVDLPTSTLYVIARVDAGSAAVYKGKLKLVFWGDTIKTEIIPCY